MEIQTCRSLLRNYRGTTKINREFTRDRHANRAIMEAIEIGGPSGAEDVEIAGNFC